MFTRKKEETKRNTQEKRNVFRRVGTVVSGLAASLAYAVPAFAADSYLGPITKLKTVLLSIAAPAGVIVVIFGGIKFAESFQKKDQGGEYSAIYTVIAGGVLFGLSAVISALGV